METKNSVLIIDDEPLNIHALARMLQPEYVCIVASSGAIALEIAEQRQPDIVLLDVMMPDMDGYEVLGRLRGSDLTKHIPVVFITGLEDSKSEEMALLAGAADFISKPFSEAVVKLRIKNQLQIVNQLREKKRREIAEEENRAKTRFLARMSHEIRTPMSAVIGLTQLQLQNPNHPPETEEAFLRIYNSSTLLLTIINDILDFSKVEADKMEIVPIVYETANLFSDTVLLNMMSDKCLKFIPRIDESLPAAMLGDEARIRQILNNLLSNAFKYTDEGHVVLEVGQEKIPGSEDIMLLIRVQDTGQGMTREQLDSLFAVEFTRFNLKVNHAVEGSGLGLLIAHRLTALMNGSISVESEVGKGSTFTLRIPQTPQGSEVLGKQVANNLRNLETIQKSLKKPARITPVHMPHGRVLLVDDVETNLHLVENILAQYSISVESVGGGLDAVEKIQMGEVYDIIFMDHMMPDLDGVEATKIIRGMGYKHPIIAYTANVVNGVTDIFLQNGFNEVVSKPIDLNQFHQCLLRYIKAN